MLSGSQTRDERALHDYVVISYNLNSRQPYENRRSDIRAATAEDAVHAVLKSPIPYASRTRRFQRHPDPAARDNAYFQIDWRGLIGAHAMRKECFGREKQIEDEQKRIIDLSRQSA